MRGGKDIGSKVKGIHSEPRFFASLFFLARGNLEGMLGGVPYLGSSLPCCIAGLKLIRYRVV